MQLVSPATPQAAQALADKLGTRARFIAGGTIVQQEWTSTTRHAPADICFINTQGWPQTQTIDLTGKTLRIGANARLETVRGNDLVRARAPLLCEAIGQLGATGVRRMGTLGGNVGWGLGDTAPVMLILDAVVELADGTLEPLEVTLSRSVRPLMLAFHLPCLNEARPAHATFEKIGYRLGFTPARVRIALRWLDASRGRGLIRAAAAAPGTSVRRLAAVEQLMATAVQRPTLLDVRTACSRELPDSLAVMVSRLIAGHCGLL